MFYSLNDNVSYLLYAKCNFVLKKKTNKVFHEISQILCKCASACEALLIIKNVCVLFAFQGRFLLKNVQTRLEKADLKNYLRSVITSVLGESVTTVGTFNIYFHG